MIFQMLTRIFPCKKLYIHKDIGKIMFSTENINKNNFVNDNDDERSEYRFVKTMKKDIKVSPQKLNMLARQIRGLSVTDALVQMKFSHKQISSVVQKTIQNAVNLADIKYSIDPKFLKIDYALVGKGQYLKRIRYHGKGRSGVMHRPRSHLTIALREYDGSQLNTKPKFRNKEKYLNDLAKEKLNISVTDKC